VRAAVLRTGKRSYRSKSPSLRRPYALLTHSVPVSKFNHFRQAAALPLLVGTVQHAAKFGDDS